jgi:hypothetical protein
MIIPDERNRSRKRPEMGRVSVHQGDLEYGTTGVSVDGGYMAIGT